MPTRGTTFQKSPIGITGGSYFNPRAHEGHDLRRHIFPPRNCISIHVPTRGTTTPYRGQQSEQSYFNPRAHEGHDPMKRTQHAAQIIFQSTCPRGARPTVIFTPVGSNKFQSTCPRGARLYENRSKFLYRNFNPRAHEGHDTGWEKIVKYRKFQSTCPRGARHPVHHRTPQPLYFNPRAHEGHDCHDWNHHGHTGISIHVPTRGTTKR